VNQGTLNSILNNNVVDIRFNRRRSRPGAPITRRMLCTLDESVLNSVNGRTVLNYLPGGSKLPYDPRSKNLCLAWDIMMQSFRMIPADSTTILNQYPGDDTFWTYFNENVLPMDTSQKIQFMNS